ncbi:MAG: SDR family oxidoreductase [Dehalococcoidales bacterium]|nr:SDR family oxidoreductase [Dehalococcoidales bacterium]
MDCSLQGKIALITGGSRGIGEASALACARAGADVALTSRKTEELERVAGEIRKLGRKALVISAHIGHMDELKGIADKVKQEFGRIDILVNNAGVSPALTGVLDTEERLWDTIMNVNLKGLFFFSQAVAKIMKEQGGGSIINIASISGIRPEKNQSVYAVSKAGAIMATRAMALELAPYNIRVNAIAPGVIMTKMGYDRLKYIPGDKEFVESRTPMRRPGQPSEIADAVVYLASDASSYVNGATLEIHGGMLLT